MEDWGTCGICGEKTYEGACANCDSIDAFLKQYLETALWSSIDENEYYFDSNYTIDDFSDEAMNRAMKDCALFIKKAKDLLNDDDEKNGHNFWLSRNGHGAGFFDEDTYDSNTRKALQELSKEFGECYLFENNNKIDLE